MNLGSAIDISPVRMATFPLLPGSMQKLFLSTREAYADLVGPERALRDRLAQWQRSRKRFSSPIVGVAPPLMLQQRKSQAAKSQQEGKAVLILPTPVLAINISAVPFLLLHAVPSSGNCTIGMLIEVWSGNVPMLCVART